jgi:hypothetical protein
VKNLQFGKKNPIAVELIHTWYRYPDGKSLSVILKVSVGSYREGFEVKYKMDNNTDRNSSNSKYDDH